MFLNILFEDRKKIAMYINLQCRCQDYININLVFLNKTNFFKWNKFFYINLNFL